MSRLILSRNFHARENYFDYPVSKKILIKNQILKFIQTLYYQSLNEKHFNFINRSCINIEAVSSMPGSKTIFLFFHQLFIKYLPVWLSEKGLKVHVLVNRKGPKPYPYFISVLDSQAKHYSHFYKPVITSKILLDNLSKGEVLLLAADGRAGKHFIQVKFGNGTLNTPRGIFTLSQVTGALIVPVFVRLNNIMPSPKFELLTGDHYQIKAAPEQEMKKIDSIFSWYYHNLKEQPYMWNRLSATQQTAD